MGEIKTIDKIMQKKENPEIIANLANEQDEAWDITERSLKTARYFEAVGRRKTSVARVRLFTQGDKNILVNGKPCEHYFPGSELQGIIASSLDKMKALDKFRVEVKVSGGGVHSQAEAIRHGIARALLKLDETSRKTLRGAGFLTRDSRKKERKKPGLKRARRAPQWAKR